MSGMPSGLAGDEHDEDDDGLRGGRGGGGGETGVSAPVGVTAGVPTGELRCGDECCETSDRLRAGNGGGTSQPRLSHPPPSAAPGGRLTRPALPERLAVLPKCADCGRWAGDGDRCVVGSWMLRAFVRLFFD